MTLDIPWKPEYGDKNSDAYKKIAAQIEQTLLENLKSAGVAGIKVVSLESGSVVVKFIIIVMGVQIEISVINKAVNNAVSNGGLSALNATGTVTVTGK